MKAEPENRYRTKDVVLHATQPVKRRWMDLREAANYMCVNVRCVRELIWTGKLGCAQVGKKFIVDCTEIDALIEQRRHVEIDASTGQKQAHATNRQ